MALIPWSKALIGSIFARLHSISGADWSLDYRMSTCLDTIHIDPCAVLSKLESALPWPLSCVPLHGDIHWSACAALSGRHFTPCICYPYLYAFVDGSGSDDGTQAVVFLGGSTPSDFNLIGVCAGPVVYDPSHPHFLGAPNSSSNSAELSALVWALLWLRLCVNLGHIEAVESYMPPNLLVASPSMHITPFCIAPCLVLPVVFVVYYYASPNFYIAMYKVTPNTPGMDLQILYQNLFY